MKKLIEERNRNNLQINKGLFFQQVKQFEISFLKFDLSHVPGDISIMSEVVIDCLLDSLFIIFLESKLSKIDAGENIESIHNLVVAFTVGSHIFRQIIVLRAPLINPHLAKII